MGGWDTQIIGSSVTWLHNSCAQERPERAVAAADVEHPLAALVELGDEETAAAGGSPSP